MTGRENCRTTENKYKRTTRKTETENANGPTQMTVGTTTMLERMIATTMNIGRESDGERNRDGGLPKDDRPTTTARYRLNQSQNGGRTTVR